VVVVVKVKVVVAVAVAVAVAVVVVVAVAVAVAVIQESHDRDHPSKREAVALLLRSAPGTGLKIMANGTGTLTGTERGVIEGKKSVDRRKRIVVTMGSLKKSRHEVIAKGEPVIAAGQQVRKNVGGRKRRVRITVRGTIKEVKIGVVKEVREGGRDLSQEIERRGSLSPRNGRSLNRSPRS